MNNADRKLQLIKKIVDADDAFLKRLDDFMNIDENRLEVVRKLVLLDSDEWEIFLKNYNQFVIDLDNEKPKRDLYKLIKEERHLIGNANDLSPKHIQIIERFLIGGRLIYATDKNKGIAEKLSLLEDKTIISKDVSNIRKVMPFLEKSDLAKLTFLKGIIKPDVIQTHIIENEYLEKINNFEEYLTKLIENYSFKLNGDDFIIPSSRRAEKRYENRITSITNTEIEKFNKHYFNI